MVSMTGGPPEKSQRVSLLPVFLIVLVDVFGMTLVIPLLAIYAETFHATPLQATMLVSVFAACQLVSGPIIGHMSDRVGRKPMLLISQVGTFIGFIVMARAQALWMLYIARVLDGSTAGNLSLAQAYISDHTEPSQRAKSFGLIGIAFGVGFFIGPSLTGYLSAKYGLTTPIYLAAVMSATSVLCTATLLKGGRQSEHAFDDREKALQWKTYAKYFGRPGLRERLLQFLFFITSFSLFISGFALFAERRFTYQGHPFGPREIGYVFGYVGFLGIILQGGLIGRLVKRFGEASLVAAGFIALAVGYFGLGIATSFVLLMLTGTLAAFGNGVIRPALTSLITQQAGRQEQGVVLGITQSLMSMASIVSPIVAGLLIERHLLKEWAWVAAGLAAIGVALSREGLGSYATASADSIGAP
jgi:MFS family permease